MLPEPNLRAPDGELEHTRTVSAQPGSYDSRDKSVIVERALVAMLPSSRTAVSGSSVAMRAASCRAATRRLDSSSALRMRRRISEVEVRSVLLYSEMSSRSIISTSARSVAPRLKP